MWMVICGQYFFNQILRLLQRNNDHESFDFLEEYADPLLSLELKNSCKSSYNYDLNCVGIMLTFIFELYLYYIR